MANSAWGYAHRALSDAAGVVNSEWGYFPVSLVDPDPTSLDSPWGTATVFVQPPHHPIGVFLGGQVRFVPLLSWDGSTLRGI